MSPTKVWVLTKELNEYDQYGAYFVTVFKEKPTVDLLSGFIKETPDIGLTRIGYYKWVLNGGGRFGDEYEWYHLTEVECN